MVTMHTIILYSVYQKPLTRRYFRINSEQSVSVHCRPTEYYRYYCFGGHVYKEVIGRDKKTKYI